MLVATKVKMSEGKKKQTNKQTETCNIFTIKRLARKFRVVVMQNNGKELYKKGCCTSKIVVVFFFCYN